MMDGRPAVNAETDVTLDLARLSAELEGVLKLRTPPIGMKLFESMEEMEAIPKVRRPKAVFTLDQVVGQAARLGWTVGVTAADLVGDQCRSVVGLGGQDEEWYSGRQMAGVWFATVEDSAKHQAAMTCVPAGRYRALVVGPLHKWPGTPDIALFYATPGAMIYFINGLQWSGY